MAKARLSNDQLAKNEPNDFDQRPSSKRAKNQGPQTMNQMFVTCFAVGAFASNCLIVAAVIWTRKDVVSR